MKQTIYQPILDKGVFMSKKENEKKIGPATELLSPVTPSQGNENVGPVISTKQDAEKGIKWEESIPWYEY